MQKVNAVLSKYLDDKSPENKEIMYAAKNINCLLRALDLNAEVVPENNIDMLSRLLSRLKNYELTAAEKAVIAEIVAFDKKNI